MGCELSTHKARVRLYKSSLSRRAFWTEHTWVLRTRQPSMTELLPEYRRQVGREPKFRCPFRDEESLASYRCFKRSQYVIRKKPLTKGTWPCLQRLQTMIHGPLDHVTLSLDVALFPIKVQDLKKHIVQHSTHTQEVIMTQIPYGATCAALREQQHRRHIGVPPFGLYIMTADLYLSCMYLPTSTITCCWGLWSCNPVTPETSAEAHAAQDSS